MRHPRLRLARFLTEVFAPTVLVSVILLLVGTAAVGWPQGFLYALAAAAFTVLIPFGIIYLLSRRGILSDHHVGERRQRGPVLAGALFSVAVGFGVLSWLGTPAAVTGAVLVVMAGIVSVGLVNLVWKLSAHAAVATCLLMAAALLHGPWALSAACPVALAVGWSRVVLGDHTPLQVAAGWVLGLAVGTIFVPVLG